MRKTKIVCTIGPATRSEETIKELIKAGMNVARLNFSHGSHEYHLGTIEMIKKVRKELDCPLAILLDTKGPEIRTKSLKDSKPVVLQKDNNFLLTTRDIEGDEKEVSITYKSLPQQLFIGTTVLIDDGKIKLTVEQINNDTDIICKINRGGELGEKKGINIPGINIDMPYLNENDKADILFGIENDVDFIAASFVRTKNDVTDLRKFINYNSGHDIKIISKIENMEGVDNFDEILRNSDGIMIARGDMGVEVEFEKLPGLQKRFIKKCYQSGKMVITATQMLESMIKNPTPTRAEITDVANAVFDGTSAIMLSGETAMGEYPIKAVKVMAKIAQQAEKDSFDMSFYSNISYEMDEHDSTNAVCDAACTMARDIHAKAIIAPTMGGNTVRNMSKFRPYQPIVASTPKEKTFNQLALSWGVYPVMARYQHTSDDLFLHAIDCAKMIDIVEDGDLVVIAAAMPLELQSNTNILKVEVVGNKKR